MKDRGDASYLHRAEFVLLLIAGMFAVSVFVGSVLNRSRPLSETTDVSAVTIFTNTRLVAGPPFNDFVGTTGANTNTVIVENNSIFPFTFKPSVGSNVLIPPNTRATISALPQMQYSISGPAAGFAPSAIPQAGQSVTLDESSAFSIGTSFDTLATSTVQGVVVPVSISGVISGGGWGGATTNIYTVPNGTYPKATRIYLREINIVPYPHAGPAAWPSALDYATGLLYNAAVAGWAVNWAVSAGDPAWHEQFQDVQFGASIDLIAYKTAAGVPDLLVNAVIIIQ